MAGLSTFKSAPKGSKRVQNGQPRFILPFYHLGPFWARLDLFGPFQTKNDFLLKSTSAKPYFVHMEKQIDFCLKWSKSVQLGLKGSQIVKNI